MTEAAVDRRTGATRAFYLLGRFQVRIADRAMAELDGTKIRELLGYLLLYRHQQHNREVLADALWSGRTTAQSRKYLRQGLWRIQTAIGRAGGDLLLVDPDWIQVNQGALGWLDVAEFEAGLNQVKGIRGRDLSASAARDLRHAAGLYSGDLLEGWYQDWCVYERQRFKARYIAMLERLLEYAETNHQLEDALQFGDLILEHDRAHERTHVRMMRVHYLSGDRTAAMRQFQLCADVLDQELGARPAARTIDLYQQIRADRVTDDLLTEPEWGS
jgi:DNA-binding SARP family transcriptional activator